MNLKKLYAVVGILAVIAAILSLFKGADSRSPEDPRIGDPLATQALLRDVATIRMTEGEAALTFRYHAESSKWLLEERFNLPADMQRLGEAIAQLTEARLERVASTRPDRIAEFGFEDARIDLLDARNERLARIELGRSTDAGKQLVRFGGEDKAFLANAEIVLDPNPSTWLDKRLHGFERDDLRRAAIVLQNGESLIIERESATADWTTAELPEGKELDQGAITRALNRFSNLTFTDARAKASDEVEDAIINSHSYTLTLENESTLQYRIGRRPEVKTEQEVEVEDPETGEPTTETQEEVETPAGPVFVFITSSDQDAPINTYMERAAFEVSAFNFTSLPASIDALLKDAEPPPPPIEEEEEDEEVEAE